MYLYDNNDATPDCTQSTKTKTVSQSLRKHLYNATYLYAICERENTCELFDFLRTVVNDKL